MSRSPERQRLLRRAAHLRGMLAGIERLGYLLTLPQTNEADAIAEALLRERQACLDALAEDKKK